MLFISMKKKNYFGICRTIRYPCFASEDLLFNKRIQKQDDLDINMFYFHSSQVKMQKDVKMSGLAWIICDKTRSYKQALKY